MKKTIESYMDKGKKFSPFTAVIVFFLILYSIALLGLLVWAFLNSFKGMLQFNKSPISLDFEWVTTNYKLAWEEFYIEIPTMLPPDNKVYMAEMFLYGFLYAFGCSFAATFVPCLVGYLCAKFKYKFSNIIYLVVILVMIIPIFGNLPAEIKMVKTFGMMDAIWGTWIMKANFLGLYFIVFYNFYKHLPDAYLEAAKIDGASNLRLFFRIILPLATPLFFTVMLINFITFWNDYQTPLIYLHSTPTIALGMYNIGLNTDPRISAPTTKIAASVLVLTPVLILFLIFHKKLLGNLTMGGIKG